MPQDRKLQKRNFFILFKQSKKKKQNCFFFFYAFPRTKKKRHSIIQFMYLTEIDAQKVEDPSDKK